MEVGGAPVGGCDRFFGFWGRGMRVCEERDMIRRTGASRTSIKHFHIISEEFRTTRSSHINIFSLADVE